MPTLLDTRVCPDCHEAIFSTDPFATLCVGCCAHEPAQVTSERGREDWCNACGSAVYPEFEQDEDGFRVFSGWSL